MIGLYPQFSLCVLLECFLLHHFPICKASIGSDECVPCCIWDVRKVFHGINLEATFCQQIVKRREGSKPYHKLRGKEFTKRNLPLQSAEVSSDLVKAVKIVQLVLLWYLWNNCTPLTPLVLQVHYTNSPISY